MIPSVSSVEHTVMNAFFLLFFLIRHSYQQYHVWMLSYIQSFMGHSTHVKHRERDSHDWSVKSTVLSRISTQKTTFNKEYIDFPNLSKIFVLTLVKPSINFPNLNELFVLTLVKLLHVYLLRQDQHSLYDKTNKQTLLQEIEGCECTILRGRGGEGGISMQVG